MLSLISQCSADINECVTGAASCAPDATCIDTPEALRVCVMQGLREMGQLCVHLC